MSGRTAAGRRVGSRGAIAPGQPSSDACGSQSKVSAAPGQLDDRGSPGGRKSSRASRSVVLPRCPACGRDDERDAPLDEHPERRRQLRIQRAGPDQLDDGARLRRDGRNAQRPRAGEARPSPERTAAVEERSNGRVWAGDDVARCPDEPSNARAYDPEVTATSTIVEPLTPARGSAPTCRRSSSEGGDPKWCWCTYFRVPRPRLVQLDGRPEPGRPGARRQDAGPDRAPGLVAYATTGSSAGSASGRARTTSAWPYSTVLAPVDDTPVWSIVCFVVGRRSRGQGVAGALLDAAIDYARDHGATTLEAYPVDATDGRAIPPANAYQGTLAMFERAGFEVVATRASGTATAPVRADRPAATSSDGRGPRLRHPSRLRHRHPSGLTRSRRGA